MVTGELPFDLLFEPLSSLVVLTGGAMTIPARAKDWGKMTLVDTKVEVKY